MMLNGANVTNKSLLKFQTSIGAAAHANLEAEQLISCTKIVIVNTNTSLWGFNKSNGEVIQVSEVQDFLDKVHDILHKVSLNSLVMQLTF